MRVRLPIVIALACAALVKSDGYADLVITEVHYDPVDTAGTPRPDLEFVEIYNDGSEPYDLSGYQFTRGFAFAFPSATFLGAQSYVAVCRDVTAATSYYGISNTAGGFTQILDNSGETIEFSNPQGAMISTVSYNDRGRWPSGAKGTGHSLSIRYPYSDPSDPDSWTLSGQMGGTPGADNFAGQAGFPATVPIVINEGYCRNGGAGTRFIELYNTSGSAVDLTGYHLSDDFSDLMKFAIPAGTSISPRAVLAFTEAQTGLDFAFVPVSREEIAAALTNPAGTGVADAVIFEPAAEGRSEARIPDGDRVLQPAANPTQGATNSSPVITGVIFNEIMFNPITGSDADEYIELYNRGASAVDLSDWRADGVGLTFPPGTTIDAGAYLVIARDPVHIQTVHGLSGALVHSTAWLGSLKDSGERLKLIDSSGNVADAVSYKDGGEWAVWPDGGGSSLELIDPAGDNSAGGSWDASDDSAKAATAVITYGPVPYGGGESDFGMMLADPGIAIIDDISLVRVGTATNLIQNGTFESNTAPWRIEGTHIHSGRTTSAPEIITGAGSMKLICWNGGGDYKVNRIEEDTAGQTTGNYNVSFNARWVVGSPRLITIGDYSQSSNPGLAGSNAMPVPAALGTPGAQNSVTARQISRTGSSNAGPAIDRVSHSPGVPEANEQVTVSARVRDPDGVSSVRLFYRTETPTGAFTQVSLDDADGDGVYGGAIPGQALDIRVLYYVEATDGSGAVSRFPTDVLQRTHPPVLDPAAPQPNDYLYCMYRHDTRSISTSNHSYRFVLNQLSQDYLRTRRIHSNEMVDGTFVFGSGDVYYNSQIRFAGSPFLRRANTYDNSYSIKMPKGNPLHERKKAFNLDQHGTDGNERIAHYLLRHSAGSTTLPYYDFHTLVRFQLNNVKTATFEALDKPNGQYVSTWFPGADDGPFFEMDDRFEFNDSGGRTGNSDGRLQYPPYGATGGDNKENYRWFFSPRSNESADDFAPFQELCRILDEGVTSNTTFDASVWDHLDVEEVLRVWAVEMNIDDWDTWAGRRGKNCYFYQSTADGLWRLIPWDLELTFSNVNAFSLPATPASTYGNFFAEIQRMINRPRIKRMYYGILAEQVNTATGFFRSGFLTPFMQQLAGAGVGRTNVGTSGGFIDSRANLIRGWIRSSIYPQVRLAISTNGGANFASSLPAVNLAGNAPADVFFLGVLLNGQVIDPAPPSDFSSADMTGWTVSGVPIGPGVNTIDIIGLSGNGNIVDSDSIRVTSSAGWNAPSIAYLDPAAARAGETVTISGSDFHAELAVYFGAVKAASVAFDEAADPTQISVLVPAGTPAGGTSVMVRNLDNQDSNLVSFTVVPPPQSFIRGDGNLDGEMDLSDSIKVLLHLFAGIPGACEDALDADDSGFLNTTDAVYILNALFRAGPAPAAPFPAKGMDPTAEDELGCQAGLQ